MDLLICIILLAIIIPAVYASIIGAPTLSSVGPHIKKALKEAGVKNKTIFYELGTGTGKVSVEALEMGAEITGYELSPLFYLISFIRLKIIKKPFKLKFKNFLKEDISDAEIIYFFLMPKSIEKIKNKLVTELKPNTKIISYAFPIKEWVPIQKIEYRKKPTIYIYEIKSR